MAGQPPVSPSRSTARPRRAANPASSVVGEAQVLLGQLQHRALGDQPGQRDGRRPPAGQQHVAVGGQGVDQRGEPAGAGRAGRQPVGVVDDQAHGGRGAAPHRVRHRRGTGRVGPGGRTRPGPLPADATAASRSRASMSPSASPGARPSHTSSPRGPRRFSATAWARRVVLPSPGPPTTTVTRCSQRPSSARSRRGRVSEPDLGSGGSNRNERGMWRARLSRLLPGWGD